MRRLRFRRQNHRYRSQLATAFLDVRRQAHSLTPNTPNKRGVRSRAPRLLCSNRFYVLTRLPRTLGLGSFISSELEAQRPYDLCLFINGNPAQRSSRCTAFSSCSSFLGLPA